eukprot:m.203006 g.203006  ORF g.203006 m.203006 type:complete len:526 (+) comp15755_c0_seq29:51-1628(+)
MMKQQTQPVRKRKRTDKEDESKTAVSSAEEASEIAKCIVDGGTKNANRIILLLNTIESNDTKEDTMLASVKGLAKVFQSFSNTVLAPKKEKNKKVETVRNWLLDQQAEFIEILLRLVPNHAATAVNYAALEAMIEVMRNNKETSEEYEFPYSLLSRLLKAMVSSTNTKKEILEALVDDYCNFDDVRYYLLKAFAKLFQSKTGTQSQSKSTMLQNSFLVLNSLEMPTSTEDISRFLISPEPHEDHSIRQLKSHKKVFSECWLTYLENNIPSDIFREILISLPEEVMPHMTNPKLLIDFLRDSYDLGGYLSILALHGVFVLIYQYNLDYPKFYEKLYLLLNGDVFEMEHRKRFFGLLDKFLSSSMLPAYLVAAFIKRLSRLCLRATPVGCMIGIRLVYTFLKRHPSCKVLIHNPNAYPEFDPYIMSEPDPSKSRALESSLWEMQSLRSHYHPDVAKLVCVLEDPALRKKEMNLARACQTTYSKLLKQELNRGHEAGHEDTELPTTYLKPTALVTAVGWTLPSSPNNI